MIKAALILDDCALAAWQKNALDYASEYLDIQLVLSCTNTANRKQYIKNFGYYALNLFTLKNRQTRKVAYDLKGAKLVSFESIYEGAWQRIPDDIARLIADNGIQLVIKFGMALLRTDGPLASVDIFSFHHGDPSEFRGRPAGFYEMLQKKDKVGTIVQSISNKLDAGKVWAIGHSKMQHHSYKKTAVNFYANSRFLLRKALVNYLNHEPIDIECNGRNYRLPGNLTVLSFLCKLAYRKAARIAYGAFYEKKWNVVTFDAFSVPKQRSTLSVASGTSPMISNGYSFYADPFFSASGELIRLEALNAANGLGEIVEVDRKDLTIRSVLLKGKHYSYPFSFAESEREYVMPEVASHSAPYVLAHPFKEAEKLQLSGLQDKRIVDGTLLKFNDVYYLFCGLNESSADCLFLFHSDSLTGSFEPHPHNPVVVDPGRARMGGRVANVGGELHRFGQNNCFGYGDGVTVSQIVKLSKTDYEERVVGSLSFSDAAGPHTVDIHQSSAVLDYYIDRFSLLAGYRRLLPVLLKRK